MNAKLQVFPLAQWRRIRRALVVVVISLGFAMTGLWAGAATKKVNLAVTPKSSTLDAPLAIQVTGLRQKQLATVRVTSTDVAGITWSAKASFVADQQGDIDLSHAAPRSGSYTGVQSMGLIDQMTTTSTSRPDSPAGYSWGESARDFRFTVEVGGSTVASTLVRRSTVAQGGPITKRDISVAEAGFVGQYFAPAPGAVPHPAVLRFTGSSGGLGRGVIGASLATHGYPTLSIAYFGVPSVPSTLRNIPLEYFARALTWLSTQPGVDKDHLWVMGSSKGTEAALLLGVYYPTLVYGVITLDPSNVVHCGIPCDGPAWTFNGKGLPYTTQNNIPQPTDDAAAVIPVERIRGPLMTLCGTSDMIWASCTYAKAIADRLAAAGSSLPHLFLSYPNAGHDLAQMLPYSVTGPEPPTEGSKPGGNSAALVQAWPRFLSFLNDPSKT